MKVIRVDNFNRKGPGAQDDILVLDGLNQRDAQALADRKNIEWGGDGAEHFWKAVPNNYKLRIFEP